MVLESIEQRDCWYTFTYRYKKDTLCLTIPAYIAGDYYYRDELDSQARRYFGALFIIRNSPWF